MNLDEMMEGSVYKLENRGRVRYFILVEKGTFTNVGKSKVPPFKGARINWCDEKGYVKPWKLTRRVRLEVLSVKILEQATFVKKL